MHADPEHPGLREIAKHRIIANTADAIAKLPVNYRILGDLVANGAESNTVDYAITLASLKHPAATFLALEAIRTHGCDPETEALVTQLGTLTKREEELSYGSVQEALGEVPDRFRPSARIALDSIFPVYDRLRAIEILDLAKESPAVRYILRELGSTLDWIGQAARQLLRNVSKSEQAL